MVTSSTDESKDRLCFLINLEGETHLLIVPGLNLGLVMLSLKQLRRYCSLRWDIF